MARKNKSISFLVILLAILAVGILMFTQIKPFGAAVISVGGTPEVLWVYETPAWAPLTDTVAADFDNDGKPEVAAISYDTSVHMIDDDGSPVWDDEGYMGQRLDAGDFDGNGVPDVIVGDYYDSLVVLNFNGDEVYNYFSSYYCLPTDVEVGNVFPGGGADAVVGDNCLGDTLIAANIEVTGWEKSTPTAAIALGDLNEDGQDDVVMINVEEGGTIIAYDSVIGGYMWDYSPGDGQAIEIGNINSDEHLEVVAGVFDTGSCQNDIGCGFWEDDISCWDYSPVCDWYEDGYCVKNKDYCESLLDNNTCLSYSPICNWGDRGPGYCIASQNCPTMFDQPTCESANCTWDNTLETCHSWWCNNITDYNNCTVPPNPFCEWVNGTGCFDEYPSFCDEIVDDITCVLDNGPACLWAITDYCTENVPCEVLCGSDAGCCSSYEPTCSMSGSSYNILALDNTGAPLWSYPTDNKIVDIEIRELTLTSAGNEIVAITAGEMPATVYVLDGSGNLLWTADHSGYDPYNIWREYSEIDLIRIADVTGDGNNEVVIGADDGFVYVYDNAGNLVWSFDASSLIVNGNGPLAPKQVINGGGIPIYDIEVADFDNDGVDDVLVAYPGGSSLVFVLKSQVTTTAPEEEEPAGGGASGVSTGQHTGEGTYDLGFNNRLNFNVNGDSHGLRLSKINDDNVDVVITSDPLTVNVKIGETKKVDVNDDGTYDIAITLHSIAEDKKTAKVTLNQIFTPEEAAVLPTPEETAATKAAEEATMKKVARTRLISIGLIALLAAVLVVFYIMETQRRRKHKGFF